MKQKIQIFLVALLLVMQVSMFDLVQPTAAAPDAALFPVGCQERCSCGGGWYCTGQDGVELVYRVPYFHTCIQTNWYECSYWCYCEPCGTADHCVLP